MESGGEGDFEFCLLVYLYTYLLEVLVIEWLNSFDSSLTAANCINNDVCHK